MATHQNDIHIVHSSDLHIDDGYTMRAWGGDGNGPLVAIIDAARAASADLLLLTGDVFEHNRLKNDVLARTASLLTEAAMQVVLLPGNHDPLTATSVWVRGGLTEIANVHVLGHSSDSALFPGWDLEVWGRAHTDYDDMCPLANPPARRARRHLVAGHGHFVELHPGNDAPRAAWLITPEDIEATAADYVALGHWNVRTEVGSENVRAWYSGAPDYAGTVNLVRMRSGGSEIKVETLPVSAPSGH